MNSVESKDSASAAGGLEAGYAAVTTSAGMRILDDRKIVRVVGDDRATFFHGMCSADVKGAAPGAILPALILTEHAHVIADLFIWVTKDALLLDIEHEAWTRARAHLEKLLVADDVEFEDELELSIIEVEGPQAADAVQFVTSEAPSLEKPWSHNGIEWKSDEIQMLAGRMPRFGAPSFSLIAPSADASSLVARMVEQIPGARIVDAAVLEIIRVENGIARVGVDTTDKTIALEARLNRAISFNKGCYVGQETIERATARGGLKKRLLGLKLEGVAESGAVVSLQSKEVGRLGSVVWSPRFGAIALAILHHSAWQPGTRVAVAESGEATVSDLPFA